MQKETKKQILREVDKQVGRERIYEGVRRGECITDMEMSTIIRTEQNGRR